MALRSAGNGRLVVTLIGLVTAAGGLLATAPTPGGALRTLLTAVGIGLSAEAAGPVDPLAPLLALVALAAWAVLGWLLVVIATAVTSRLPGLAGRLASFVCARIAPDSVRRVVEMGLGLTVAASIIGAPTAASASPAVPPAPSKAPAALDWPSPPGSLDWNPAAAGGLVARYSPAPPRTAPAAVVVRPGDSLWSVAADHLRAGAPAAQIAQAWPSWWAANRDAVGPNPDLIQPGLQLTPPAQH